MEKELSIQISRTRVETLFALYEWLISGFTYETAHDFLLHSHIVDMYWRLEGMLECRGRKSAHWKKKTMWITQPEAVAFCQVFKDTNIDHNPSSKVVVAEIVKEINKSFIQAKLLEDE